MRRTSSLFAVSCLCSAARAGSKKPLQLPTLALLAAPPRPGARRLGGFRLERDARRRGGEQGARHIIRRPVANI
jgi:hypothetical protein